MRSASPTIAAPASAASHFLPHHIYQGEGYSMNFLVTRVMKYMLATIIMSEVRRELKSWQRR